MTDNRLGAAVSPYLRMHADNPVDWREWGRDAFVEAAERDVPVFVSIGYATCHWCHVMARESFSDPAVAEILRRGFVSVKVDREERPDVDASAMIAASAFTQELGWPLNVFMTPGSRVFYAGTYYPPVPVGAHPSFRQILGAVAEAWTNRREEVDANADALATAIAARTPATGDWPLPPAAAIHDVVMGVARAEDTAYGGFGGAPKFPNAPLIEFLADAGAAGDEVAADLAERTVATIAGSELTDPVDGGVFRYATRRDWTVPHYERMLYDNAGLLAAAGALAASRPDGPGAGLARGIARFLHETLRTPEGTFAAAQDSESTIDGERVEGAWYRLDREGRSRLDPPPLEDQVLTGWNGLAVRGLSIAGAVLGDERMLADARSAADRLLATHVRDGRVLIRADTPRGASGAPPTIEDIGLLAEGLLELALATGEAAYATAARSIVDGVLDADGEVTLADAADPILAAAGIDPGEQPQTAIRSGTVGLAAAAVLLAELTGEGRYRSTAERLVARSAAEGLREPLGHADALGLALALQLPPREIVVVVESGPRPGLPGDAAEGDAPEGDAPEDDGVRMRRAARAATGPGTIVAVVTAEQCRAFQAAGFALFADRDTLVPAAYVCHDRVCDLPARTAEAFTAAL